MKRVSFFNISTFFLFVCFAACRTDEKEDSAELAQDKNVENFGTRDGEKEADFVVVTVENSYAEIKLAQLAMNKSSDVSLKEIASMLETDNSKVLNELKDLSYKKGIAIPVEESKAVKSDIQNLQKEEQQKFTKEWLKKITDQHEAAIKDFESMQKKTKDMELKSWIAGTLPSLRSHMDTLTAYQDSLK